MRSPKWMKKNKLWFRADVIVPGTVLHTPYKDDSDDEFESKGGGYTADEMDELFEQFYPEEMFSFGCSFQESGNSAVDMEGIQVGDVEEAGEEVEEVDTVSNDDHDERADCAEHTEHAENVEGVAPVRPIQLVDYQQLEEPADNIHYVESVGPANLSDVVGGVEEIEEKNGKDINGADEE